MRLEIAQLRRLKNRQARFILKAIFQTKLNKI
jgi:hypothetical protein